MKVAECCPHPESHVYAIAAEPGEHGFLTKEISWCRMCGSLSGWKPRDQTGSTAEWQAPDGASPVMSHEEIMAIALRPARKKPTDER